MSKLSKANLVSVFPEWMDPVAHDIANSMGNYEAGREPISRVQQALRSLRGQTGFRGLRGASELAMNAWRPVVPAVRMPKPLATLPERKLVLGS